MEKSSENNHILKAYSLAKDSLGKKLSAANITKEIKSQTGYN